MRKILFFVLFFSMFFIDPIFAQNRPSIKMEVFGIPEGYVDVGESFTVMIKVKNTGAWSSMGGISMPMPDYDMCSYFIEDYSTKDGKVYSRGEDICDVKTRKKFSARYPLIEAWQGNGWPGGTSHYIKVNITPRKKGIMRFFVRCVLRDAWDEDVYCPSFSEDTDQQDAYVSVYTVKIGKPPTPTPVPTVAPTPVPVPISSETDISEAPTKAGGSPGLSLDTLLYILIGLLALIVFVLVLKMKLSPVPVYSSQTAGSYSLRNPAGHNTVTAVNQSYTVKQSGICPGCGSPFTPGKKFCATCGFSTVTAIAVESEKRICPSCSKVLLDSGEAICSLCLEKYKAGPVMEKTLPLKINSCMGCGLEQDEMSWRRWENRCPECGFENEF